MLPEKLHEEIEKQADVIRAHALARSYRQDAKEYKRQGKRKKAKAAKESARRWERLEAKARKEAAEFITEREWKRKERHSLQDFLPRPFPKPQANQATPNSGCACPCCQGQASDPGEAPKGEGKT